MNKLNLRRWLHQNSFFLLKKTQQILTGRLGIQSPILLISWGKCNRMWLCVQNRMVSHRLRLLDCRDKMLNFSVNLLSEFRILHLYLVSFRRGLYWWMWSYVATVWGGKKLHWNVNLCSLILHLKISMLPENSI